MYIKIALADQCGIVVLQQKEAGYHKNKINRCGGKKEQRP